MTPEELASAVERYLNGGTPIPGLMPGHQERLDNLASTWCRRGEECEVHRAGDYVLVYSRRASNAALDLLDDQALHFLWSIDWDTPIEDIEIHYPSLDLDGAILLLGSRRHSLLAKSSGAIVVGLDRDTGMVFAHELPWFITGLLSLAKTGINEELVRALMGFDYNPWEEHAGEGSIVRLQGDIAVRIVRLFKDEDEARRWLATALVRYMLARAIYRAHLQLLETIQAEARSLADGARTELEAVYALNLAVARGVSRVYGERVRINDWDEVSSLVYATILRPGGTIIDLDEPRALRIRLDLDAPVTSLREAVAKCLEAKGAPCMGLESVGAALYRIAALARKHMGIDLDTTTLAAIGYHVVVEDLESLLASIADSLERQVDNIAEKILASEEPLPGDESILGRLIKEEAPGIMASLEPVEAELEVDRHTITFNGYLLRDPYVARALTLEYIAGVIDNLLKAKSPRTTLTSFRRLRKSRRGARLAVELARLLSVKTGTLYALVTGDHVIEARHPEHGNASLGLPGPALIEITALNTATRTGNRGTLFEDLTEAASTGTLQQARGRSYTEGLEL